MLSARRTLLLLALAVLGASLLPAGAQELFVASRNNDQILRLDSRGGLAGVFASGSLLDEPSCIAIGQDGAVYAGMRDSQGVRRVLCWDAVGALQFRVTASGLSTLAGVAADASGNIYASSQANSEVVRWNADRTYYNTFAYASGLSQPAGLAFAPDGKLFIASGASGQVLVWKQDGTFDRVFRSFGSSARPVDVAFSPSGDVFILMVLTGGDAGVGVYSSTGAYKRYHAGGSLMISPTGLALRPGDDSVFVSDLVSGVLQLGGDGVFRVVLPQGSSGLNGAAGIRFRDRPAVSANALVVQGVFAQGDGSAAPDGSYQVLFRFCGQASGGSPLWSSAQQAVAVSGGVFTARVESVPEWLFARDWLWLETVVGSVALSPRQLLGSQGIAVRSVSAGALRAPGGGAASFWMGPRRALALTADGAFSAVAPGGVTFATSADAAGQALAGARIAPGAGSWSTLSDAGAKLWAGAAGGEQTLERLSALPVLRWRYRGQSQGIEHMGPMAGDFRDAFGLGEDGHHIATVDADGVAMAALQSLIRRSRAQREDLARLEALVEQLQETRKP
jgi:hypothetical protein